MVTTASGGWSMKIINKQSIIWSCGPSQDPPLRNPLHQPGDPCSPWILRSPINPRDELQLHSSPWACPFFFSDPVDTGQRRKRSSKRRRRYKGPQLIIPQNRTPALEETTNPGIGTGSRSDNVFVLDTLSLVQSLTFVTLSSRA